MSDFDNKCTRQVAESVLFGYFDVLVKKKVIKKWEHKFSNNEPVVKFICYFNYKPEDASFNSRKTELYFMISFTAVRDPKYKNKAFFVNMDTTLLFLENKIEDKINERSRGEYAELRGLRIFQELKRDRKYGIREVYRGSEYSDFKGKMDLVYVIDHTMPEVFFTEKVERFCMGTDIKSSDFGQERHKKKNLKKPSLKISINDSDDIIKKRIGKLIKNSLIHLHIQYLASLIKDEEDLNFYNKLGLIHEETMKKIHQ